MNAIKTSIVFLLILALAISSLPLGAIPVFAVDTVESQDPAEASIPVDTEQSDEDEAAPTGQSEIASEITEETNPSKETITEELITPIEETIPPIEESTIPIEESTAPTEPNRQVWISNLSTLIKEIINQFTFAPYFLSTPFPKNRYQIIASFWERCRYFCKKSAVFYIKTGKRTDFSVLHNAFTAFAYNIRAPPSEV